MFCNISAEIFVNKKTLVMLKYFTSETINFLFLSPGVLMIGKVLKLMMKGKEFCRNKAESSIIIDGYDYLRCYSIRCTNAQKF